MNECVLSLKYYMTIIYKTIHAILRQSFIIRNGITLAVILLLIFLPSARAQEDPWQDYMKYMIYSPRYFGPNAFPLPELRSGYIDKRWEVEVRGEYHTYKGDQAKDIYARMFIPVAEGRAGFELSYIFYEFYNMTPETVAERHASGRTWKHGANGDVIFNSYYKIFKNDKRIGLLFEASFKTASGDRIADARYTDAASYWFDLNAGHCLYRSADSLKFITIQSLAGFYCWMTNDIVHRQNDAFLYAGGISGGIKNLTFQADIAGFYGYSNNGDRPLILRTKLNYEYRKNILSFRYKHGIHDYLYDSYSLAYIRCF